MYLGLIKTNNNYVSFRKKEWKANEYKVWIEVSEEIHIISFKNKHFLFRFNHWQSSENRPQSTINRRCNCGL